MALDVYFREDIANIFRSINLAGSGTASLVNREISRAASKNEQLDAADLAERLEIYEQGYLDALQAVAAAFGIMPNVPVEAVPDMLAAQNRQDNVPTHAIAQSWDVLKCQFDGLDFQPG
jgi:hypothetical protein